jgi:hypothetical protein
MKSALICFHKNVARYPNNWIERYKESILNQTCTNFDIFELNYGGESQRIFNSSNFISIPLKDHAEAHNYLLRYCFDRDYDLIFNTNVDDYYPLDRIEKQINSFDPSVSVSSGNYIGFSDDNVKYNSTFFHRLSIDEEFSKNHNIIAHPACCYSRKITEYGDFLISSEIPADDFFLWKRLLLKGAKFKIIPDVLLYYRISDLKTNL